MATPNHEVSEARTEELQEGIDAVRRQAEEHGTLPSEEPERTLIDPDGDGDEDEAPGMIGGL